MKTARLELRPIVPRKPEHVADLEAGRAVGWDLFLGEDVIGFAAIHHIDRRNLCAQLAYELDVEHRGKGLMTEALRFVIDHAFRDLGLHRLEAHVSPENDRSLRLAERVGLVREALLRENVVEDGRFHDTVILAILSDPRN
jgi:ribosomal-protein-alanine N-acetyltransferase